MRATVFLSLITLIIPLACVAQDQQAADGPVAVLGSSWEHIHRTNKAPVADPTRPVPMMIKENRNFEKAARDNQQRGATDPNEQTIDGRSAALEKLDQEARVQKPDDIDGYTYFAKMRNDGDRKIDVIFWEYRFTERANASNVVRRQFLCSANIKPGESRDLLVFSSLGPSDTITTGSLANTTGKIFDEVVEINRIEYADGMIIQRRDWNYKEVKKAIERVTSSPWGKEICRGF